MSTIFVVIPCFNEHTLLRKTVLSLLHREYEVVVVDDGSIPSVLPLVHDFPIHFLRHSVNLGQGASLQTGMEYAKRAGAKIVVHFDADGQHRVEDIDRLVKVLIEEKLDIVLGSRFLKAENSKNIPGFRKYLLKLGRIINGCFTGLWLSDAHNGFRVLNQKALNLISLKENRMAHATEILEQIKNNKLRYKEEAIEILYTAYSKEKGQSNWNAINIFLDLIIRKFL